MSGEEAATAAVNYLGDVQRLELKPGDIVVIKIPHAASMSQIERLHEFAMNTFPGHKCIVLDGGVSIGVMGGRE